MWQAVGAGLLIVSNIVTWFVSTARLNRLHGETNKKERDELRKALVDGDVAKLNELLRD